jgi:hypothetical protein
VKRLRKHLTFANVLACTALFMALSGAAYAATAMLPKKSVKTAHLANGSVTTLKLRGGAVTTLKLRNGAVTGAKVAPGAIGSSQLANGSVRSGQLGGGVVTEAKLKNGAVTANKIADGAVTGGKLASNFIAQLVRNVTYANKASGAVSTTSPQSATAECPAGKQVIGGGARIVPGDATEVELTESIPFLAGDGKRTGWTAAARTAEAGKTFAVEAFAVCAEL